MMRPRGHQPVPLEQLVRDDPIVGPLLHLALRLDAVGMESDQLLGAGRRGDKEKGQQ